MKLLSTLLLLVISVAYVLSQPPPAGTIWIDRLNNEQDRPSFFQLTVSCGDNGDLCNNNATIEATSVQPEDPYEFAPGTQPIGGERYHYLSIDTKQPGYQAGPADNIKATYDIAGGLGFITSPGIGGSYMLLWNGVGNNNLPCKSTLGAPCALDQLCCNTGNPVAAGFSVDLTGGGTQFGLGLYQKSADHDAPVIMRIWGADGRSVVLRKSFEARFVQRNLLFMYNEFIPFPGDSPQLTKAEMQNIFKNAKAIALQIFGAIALDARLSYLRTAGVIVSKTLPASAHNQTFYASSEICYNVFIGNNAPRSMNVPGTNGNNVLKFSGVKFLDAMLTKELELVPGSIQVSSPRAHNIDDTGNKDVVSVTLTEDLQPEDNVTINFCARVRSDWAAPFCRGTFCNQATVSLPGVAELPVGSGTAGCIHIKFDTSVNVDLMCPDLYDVAAKGQTPRVTLSYSNSGPAPAENTMLTLWIKGINPYSLGANMNNLWTCNPDTASSHDTLKCSRFIGNMNAGTSGTIDYYLNLPVLPCNITDLYLTAQITETCSNSSKTDDCHIEIPHIVQFDISKDAGLSDEEYAVGNQLVTYTISYRNLGNTQAEMVELIEEYPLYTTPVNNPGWDCDTTARRCRYYLGTVLVNEAIRTLQFTVKLDAILPEGLDRLCNTVTITNTECELIDECKDEKKVTECIRVSPGLPDTGVEKEGYIARLVYRLTYYNNGSADATNVKITENLPAGAEFDAERSDERWVCAGSTCTITLESLKQDERASVLFVVKLAQDFQQAAICWNNTATIDNGDSPVEEPSPGDNVAHHSLGACGGICEMECPNPCVECPACKCNQPACDCPAPKCNCPEPTCNCPKGKCECAEPICNCPSAPVCRDCPKCECNCPKKCDKIVEECGCKEIININLPCGLSCPSECPSASALPTGYAS